MFEIHAPMNFKHKYALVEAEKIRVCSNNWQAAEFYDLAIAKARENSYSQEEALANELAARFYRDRGMEKIARTYLRDAYYGYNHWGAKAKVENLTEKYPELLQNPNYSDKTKVTQTKSSNSTNTSTSTGAILDITTVTKAARAIGSEIVLDRLLQTLMNLLLTDAGAQRGVLLLEQQGQFTIEAEGIATLEQNQGAEITVLQSLPIGDRLPVSVIDYVVRTRETVVLDRADREGNFTADPYIQKRRSQSLLCFPLIERGNLE